VATVAQPLQRGRANAGTAETGRQLRPYLAGGGMLASYQRTGALEGSLVQIIDNQHQGRPPLTRGSHQCHGAES
jgi:hypothetical protein